MCDIVFSSFSAISAGGEMLDGWRGNTYTTFEAASSNDADESGGKKERELHVVMDDESRSG